MKFTSFLSTRRPKKFEYTPRYYDPRKEALDDLVARVKAEKEGKIPTRHQLKFERQYGIGGRERTSNLRIVALIVILTLIALVIIL